MKVLIAMSGGVDSSIAALIMKQKGYECVGCTMKLYDSPDDIAAREHTCCSLSDVEDARSIARRLDIPFHVFNFTDLFRDTVIRRFISSYESGSTPNPCIDCNRFLKFGKLFERADILGCDKIVTGHYARVETQSGKYILKKAVDPAKDQSYVLYSMTQEQLSRTLFPLGNLHKTDVRRMALANHFETADKADSQDICFVPDGDYAETIRRYTGKRYPSGPFLSADGQMLGTHKGLIRYTVGQRRGLGIASPSPLYVCRISPENNSIYLGHREDLCCRTVYVRNMNWISGETPDRELHCRVRTRYRQKEQPAVVYPDENGGARIVFDQDAAVCAPGQAAVLYQDDIVLGGGEITAEKRNA